MEGAEGRSGASRAATWWSRPRFVKLASRTDEYRPHAARRPASGVRVVLPLALMAAVACAGEPGNPGSVRVEDPALAPPDSLAGNRYERHLAFFALEDERPLVVAWSFSANTREDAVDREARIWLARGGVWDALFQSSWETPAARAPWRIIPHEGIRIIVGERDALTALLYRSAGRELEMWLGEAITGWSSRPGELIQVREASTALSESAVAGTLVDISFARQAAGATPGSWALLLSEDIQVFLRGPFDAAADSVLQGWGRLRARNFNWPEVVVTATSSRAFEPARRDLPVAWRFQSPDDGLTGRIEAMSTHMEVGEGPGPQLPLLAISEVDGSMTIETIPYRVRGILYHRAP